jgi:uncharacterized protein YndB with AHSA1/START domain
MNFKIEINAPREKVWDILLGEKTYPIWAAVFAEGSLAETDWKKGSKAIFSNGKGKGIVSRIVENVPNEYLSIEHLGMYDNGKEDLDSPEVKKWAGAKENYTLNDLGGKTELVIDMDMGDDENMIAYFESTWPKALDKVKELAEKYAS